VTAMANGRLMAQIATFNPSIGHQQDPHECMIFLLENMHHEHRHEDALAFSLGATQHSSSRGGISCISEGPDDGKIGRISIGGTSFFTDLFAIEYVVHKTACSCSSASTKFHQDWMLTLSLEKCAGDLKNVLKKFFSDEDVCCANCLQVYRPSNALMY